jgi:hypothetical protein
MVASNVISLADDDEKTVMTSNSSANKNAFPNKQTHK